MKQIPEEADGARACDQSQQANKLTGENKDKIDLLQRN